VQYHPVKAIAKKFDVGIQKLSGRRQRLGSDEWLSAASKTVVEI